MNILFLTTRFPTKPEHYTLEKELVAVFNKNGHNCSVVNIIEKKHKKNTYIENISINNKNIDLLHIKTGNLYNNVGLFEKKLTVLSLPYVIPRAVKNFYHNKKFDLIIAYGPYLCASKIIKPLKKIFNAKTLLMQWDIFPQNAYDLGIINNKLILNILKYQQKNMLSLYDIIICNSQGNIDYFKNNFNKQTNNKLFLLHNCEAIRSTISNNQDKPSKNISESRININSELKTKLGLNPSALTLLFGGNIGIPQNLESIVTLANLIEQDDPNNNIQFVIVGQGTEANKIKNLCANKNNIKFIDFLDSKDYENLVQACDIGIVSLSPRFTVPNFPAKVTSYLKCNIPILACVDDAAYNDLGNFIKKHKIGYCIRAKETNSLPKIKDIINHLSDDNIYLEYKNNTKKVFEKYFDIDNNFPELNKYIESKFESQ